MFGVFGLWTALHILQDKKASSKMREEVHFRKVKNKMKHNIVFSVTPLPFHDTIVQETHTPRTNDFE